MIAYLRKDKKGIKLPAVFLDRDGTLIHDRPGHYLTDPRKLRFYAGTVRALRLMSDLGYRLIVVTNQSGIARGYMTLARSKAVNIKLASGLAAKGVKLAGIYFCPHKPQDGCGCRKPARGLADEALRAHPTDLSRSFVIGDKLSDMKLADALGSRAVFLKSGHGKAQLVKYPAQLTGRMISPGILSAARWIKREHEKHNTGSKEGAIL